MRSKMADFFRLRLFSVFFARVFSGLVSSRIEDQWTESILRLGIVTLNITGRIPMRHIVKNVSFFFCYAVWRVFRLVGR